METRLFLKGSPCSGKTALLIRALSDLRVISGGYALVNLSEDGNVDGSCGEAGCSAGSCALVDCKEAAAAVLPGKVFSDCMFTKESFLERLPGFYSEIEKKGMGYLDPLLGAELSDGTLAERLEALLSSDMPLCGVLSDKSYAGNTERYMKLIGQLTEDKKTLILDTDTLTAEEAVEKMRVWAEATLDAQHHKKFDPLMRLRARRKRPDTIPPEFK